MLSALSLVLAAQVATSTSTPPRIELITMGAGGYLYSYWGHAALRVVDPRDGSDVAYNFGGVDVSDGTLVRMMRGYVEAYMFALPFGEVLGIYSGEDRTITRFPLKLEPSAARQLADRLRAMAAAPRAYYAYHHFADNCTTRIADELDLALDGKLKGITQSLAPGTYRTRVLRPVRAHPLLYVMLDLSYSSAVDRPITEYEASFLTPGLEALVKRAGLATNGTDVFRSIGFDESAIWSWPWTTIYMLFLCPLLVLFVWRPRIGVRIWGVLAGALGCLFAALWIGSTYDFFHGNWNLIVFPPLHLALVRGTRWRARYLGAHLCVLIAMFLLWQTGVISQAIGPALGLALPLAIAAVVTKPYAPSRG